MMNNELIPTNGLWYKVKKFFRRLFFKEKTINTIRQEKKSNNSIYESNLKEKFERENNRKALAEKLLYGEIGTIELNEDEVDEMTEYFTKDIQNIDNELLKIKQHILAMRQELKQ